jgi:hypothetical protein
MSIIHSSHPVLFDDLEYYQSQSDIDLLSFLSETMDAIRALHESTSRIPLYMERMIGDESILSHDELVFLVRIVNRVAIERLIQNGALAFNGHEWVNPALINTWETFPYWTKPDRNCEMIEDTL